MSSEKLLICGDTVPTEASAPLFACGDIRGLFGGVLDVFGGCARVIVNLECALTTSERPIRKFGPNLKGPVETAATLKAAGVTDCAIANNHILDFGVGGLRDTRRLLDAAGLGRFGCGDNAPEAAKPYFMELDGKRIALLTFAEHEYTYALPDQPGASPFDPFDAMVRIAEAKKKADYLIVLYHGGKEYCEYPSPRLREDCVAMVKLGADAVFCQHSHIVGCMERVGQGVIIYGQGNFHFVKYSDRPFWSRGLMVRLSFAEGLEMELIPIVAGAQGIDLATGQEKQEILDGFAQCSRTLENGEWLDGWRAFVAENGGHYLECVKNAFSDPADLRKLENLAHYLDCEAHLDMLHELLPTWHKTRQDDAGE